MSHSNVINEKKKALLAYKEKIEDEIKYYEKTIDEFRVNHKNISFYDDSDSSESEDEFPFAVDTGPSISELKLKQALLKTCLHATQELTSLTVLQSEVELLVEEPKIEGEPPITEPGTWKEVTAECSIDLIPFTITFYMHTPAYKFAPTSYRGLRVVPVKGSHELELSKSVLQSLEVPSDAVEVLRSYAEGYRSRRTTLARLANKYANSLFMEPHPEGGFILKCAGLLEVSWRLENKWSPVAPFHHKMKFDLEYMEESYIKIITQAHKQLLDPTIQTDERTLLLAKIIATCLEARGPVEDSDLESKTTERDNDIEKRDSEVMAPPKSLPKKGKQKVKDNSDNNAVKRNLADEDKDSSAKKMKNDNQNDVANINSTDNVKRAKNSDVAIEGNKKRKINDVNKVASGQNDANADDEMVEIGKKRKVIDDKASSVKNTKESVVNKESNAKNKNAKETDGIEAKTNNNNVVIKSTNNKTNKDIEKNDVGTANTKTVKENAVTSDKKAKNTNAVTKNKNTKDSDKAVENTKAKIDKDGAKPKNAFSNAKTVKSSDSKEVANAKKNVVSEKNVKNADGTKPKIVNANPKNKSPKDSENKGDGDPKTNIVIEAKEANIKTKPKNVKAPVNSEMNVKSNTKTNKETTNTDAKPANNKVKTQNAKTIDNNNPKTDDAVKTKPTKNGKTEVEVKKNSNKKIALKTDENEQQNKNSDNMDKKKLKNKENINTNNKIETVNTGNDVKTSKNDTKPAKNDIKNKNNNAQEKKPKSDNQIKNNVQKTTNTIENKTQAVTRTTEQSKSKQNLPQKPDKMNSKTKINNVLTVTEKNALNLNSKDKISHIKEAVSEKITKKPFPTKNIRNSLSSNKVTKPLASHRTSMKKSLPIGNTKALNAGNTEAGKTSKIPQKKFSPISQGSSKKNLLRISPRKNPMKFKMLPQEAKQKMIKTTNIPRLLKKPAPKV